MSKGRIVFGFAAAGFVVGMRLCGYAFYLTSHHQIGNESALPRIQQFWSIDLQNSISSVGWTLTTCSPAPKSLSTKLWWAMIFAAVNTSLSLVRWASPASVTL